MKTEAQVIARIKAMIPEMCEQLGMSLELESNQWVEPILEQALLDAIEIEREATLKNVGGGRAHSNHTVDCAQCVRDRIDEAIRARVIR